MTFQFPPPVTLDTLFSEPDSDYDWLVPGLLEQGDRVILTGGEGKGKSTLLRQIGVQIATGINPFTLETIDKKRVVYIDLENSKRQAKRKLSWMYENTGCLPGLDFQIANWPQGVDFLQSGYRAPMVEMLNNLWPELLIIGPMYKMAPQLEQEANSKALSEVLDEWRQVYGFTLIMESHQPHQTIVDNKKYRPERPFGSSLWLRWPEFGICLEDNGTLRHWRGQREEREWPIKLRHGDMWPWVADSRRCTVCDIPLSDKQEKYCGDKCAVNGRKRDQRARERLL